MTSAGADAGTGQAGQAAEPTASEPADESQPAAATQGPSESVLSEPVPPTAVLSEPALSQPVLPEQSREDTDIAWGDYRGRDDEDRDRLYRDRPPHWADH